jgi:(4S)-4-hydroxy-5-phosphonooxypentane-2,3-dione isomerase
MIVTFVHVWVIPDKVDAFIEASIINHRESIREPGNLRFDILRDAEDPLKFTFYEAYISEDAAKAHKETPHYKFWRDTVAEWMTRPRSGVKHEIICPQDPAIWKK